MPHIQNRTAEGRHYVAVLEDPAARSGRVSRTFLTERAAKQWLKEQAAAQVNGTYVTPQRSLVPVGELAKLYLRTRTGKRRQKTAQTEEDFVRCYIDRTFALVPGGDVDVVMVDTWTSDLLAAGYAPATVQKAFRILSAILDYAVRTKHLAANPCLSTKAPSVPRSRVRPVPKDGLKRLVQCFDPRYRLWLKLAVAAGTRPEESFALRARHVDRDRPLITIEETVVEVRSTLVADRTKTINGERRIKVPKGIWEELKAHVEDLGPDDFLFPAPDGGQMRLNNFRKRFWYPAAVKAGIGRYERCRRLDGEACPHCKNRTSRPPRQGHYVGASIHGLRHTAVSLWIANGTELLEISRRAGHSRTSFTLDFYSHQFNPTDDPTIDDFDDTIEGIFGDDEAAA